MASMFNDTTTAFAYRSDNELRRSQFLFSFIASPALTAVGTRLVQLSLKLHIPVKWALKNTIFKQFCGGETLTETSSVVSRLGAYHVDTILDYGVEGKHDEAAFDAAVPGFIDAINFAATHLHVPFVSLKITGFARFELLEKKSGGQTLTADETKEWKRVYERINHICAHASHKGIMILVDAEETWILHACNELVEAMMERYNRHRVTVFNTFQLYCSGTLSFLETSIRQAKAAGYVLGAKLVRGAYMEKERKRASDNHYPDPIQPGKDATDADFDSAVTRCLENLDHLAVFVGSHNELSNAKAVEWMQANNIPAGHPRIFFSQLLGMSDHISFNLAAQGYNVSKYVPYGPVTEVVPYLLRRAQENTSVAGQTGRELSLLRTELKRRAR